MVAAFGVLVTVFLGLVGWRLQLIGKRRTELAEEALLAFQQAIDAIAVIRQPGSVTSESDALRKDLDVKGLGPVPAEDFEMPLYRMRQQQSKFESLRRLELLCGYHFGAAAIQAFASLNGTLREIIIAARMGRRTAHVVVRTILTMRRSPQTRRASSTGRTSYGKVLPKTIE